MCDGDDKYVVMRIFRNERGLNTLNTAVMRGDLISAMHSQHSEHRHHQRTLRSALNAAVARENLALYILNTPSAAVTRKDLAR